MFIKILKLIRELAVDHEKNYFWLSAAKITQAYVLFGDDNTDDHDDALDAKISRRDIKHFLVAMLCYAKLRTQFEKFRY